MTSRSNRTTSTHRSSVRIRVPLSATACTEARIPDDKLVISSIVVAYLCAPDSKSTSVADLTKIAGQLMMDQGYDRRSVVIGFERLANSYFAP